MRSNKVLLVLWSSLLLLTAAHAQTFEETLELAELRYGEPNRDALPLYKRLLFFSDDDSLNCVFHSRIATLYQQQEQYEEAAPHYLKAATCSDTSGQDRLLLQAAYCFLLAQNPTRVIEVIDTTALPADPVLYYQALLYLGLAHEQTGQTRDAVKYYAAFFPLLNKEDSIALTKLNDELIHYTHKKPGLARTMSAVVPGSGQLYAGSAKDAIRSFTINMSLAGLFVYTSLSYTFLDGTLAFAPWFPRFYTGGITLAGRLAEEKNQHSLQQCYADHLAFFSRVKLEALVHGH